MLRSDYNEYLRFLRAGLWDEDLDCGPGDAVREIARQQATGGLVCRSGSDDESLEELARLLVANDNLDSAVSKVTGILSSAGIPSVLLKGQGLAKNYAQPWLRCCGDIDLYIGRDNYPKACGVLEGLGGKGSESAKHMHLNLDGETVELHRVCAILPSSKLDRIFQGYADKGLSENLVQVEMGGSVINTPADDFNVLFVFYHFLHHFMHGGVGLRQVCDWTMLLHSRGANVNRDELRSRLETLGLMEAWQVFGNLAVRHLGLPSEEMPFFEASKSVKADKLLAAIFEYGNFGCIRHARRKVSGHYLLRKAGSLRQHTRSLLTAFRIFPDIALPFYWSTLKIGFRQVFIDMKRFG